MTDDQLRELSLSFPQSFEDIKELHDALPKYKQNEAYLKETLPDLQAAGVNISGYAQLIRRSLENQANQNGTPGVEWTVDGGKTGWPTPY